MARASRGTDTHTDPIGDVMALRRQLYRHRRTAPLAGALGLATVVGMATGAAVPAEAAPVEPVREPEPRTAERPALRVAPGPAAGGTTDVPRERDQQRRYTVRGGDTVTAIAARHDSSVRAIVDANDLDARALIRIGQVLVIPSAGSAQQAQQTSSGGGDESGSRYTVRAGDTVTAIAAHHGTTTSAIVDANDLDSRALIRIGQTLVVPGSGGSSASSGGTGSSTSGSSSGGSSSQSTSSGTATYTVRAGDTVGGIASRHGTTVAQVRELNDLGGAAVIFPGQRLRVPEQLVPSTFLHYSYPDDVVAAANENKRTLLATDVPGREAMQDMIASVARDMGVDPALALAVASQESGFDARAVSPANAVGAMQVIPSSGTWASDLVGRDLDLLDPRDNVVAGVAILRTLVRTSPDLPTAIAGYYQGAGSVRSNGMYPDTRRYVAGVQTLMTRFG